MHNFKIDKLRRKLTKNKNWLRNFADKLKADEKYWNDFYMFKCSDFFVGNNTAEINKKIYEKHIHQIGRKFRQAQRICELVYDKNLSDLF